MFNDHPTGRAVSSISSSQYSSSPRTSSIARLSRSASAAAASITAPMDIAGVPSIVDCVAAPSAGPVFTNVFGTNEPMTAGVDVSSPVCGSVAGMIRAEASRSSSTSSSSVARGPEA